MSDQEEQVQVSCDLDCVDFTPEPDDRREEFSLQPDKEEDVNFDPDDGEDGDGEYEYGGCAAPESDNSEDGAPEYDCGEDDPNGNVIVKVSLGYK